MATIIKTYKQNMPASRFIGKKYGDDDRVNGFFGVKWGEWFKHGWFAILGTAAGDNTLFEDSNAYIGLMRHSDNEPFQYWIGIFCPENTKVPEGFEKIDIPASSLGVSWVYGQEPDVYCQEPQCAEKLKEAGYLISKDENDACWFFERYTCPRFTTPDEQGNIILDICFFIK